LIGATLEAGPKAAGWEVTLSVPETELQPQDAP